MDILAIGRAEGDLHWLVNGIRLSRQLGRRIIEETEPLRSGWTLGPVLAYLDQLSSPTSGDFSSGHTATAGLQGMRSSGVWCDHRCGRL